MKKFRLISAVSVAVLSMSVQAMAMPLTANASTSLQCASNANIRNCITQTCDNNGSTSKNCLKSLDIESILKNVNCSNKKGSSVVPNFNCDLNGGSVDSASKTSCSKGAAVKAATVKGSTKKVTAKKVTAKKAATKKVAAVNKSCVDKSCVDKSCVDKSCADKNCADKSYAGKSCADKSSANTCNNGSCNNTSVDKGTANNVSVDKGTSNNVSVDKGTADKGSVDTNSADKGSVTTNDTSASISAYAQKVVDLVNEERAKQGINPLSVDTEVMAAAQVRAKEIQSSFSHTRPDGRSCFTALDEAGASYRGAGENIALGQKTPEQVVNDWMNSEGHRKNILNSSFKYIGVGVDNTAWTQLFTY